MTLLNHGDDKVVSKTRDLKISSQKSKTNNYMEKQVEIYLERCPIWISKRKYIVRVGETYPLIQAAVPDEGLQLQDNVSKKERDGGNRVTKTV